MQINKLEIDRSDIKSIWWEMRIHLQNKKYNCQSRYSINIKNYSSMIKFNKSFLVTKENLFMLIGYFLILGLFLLCCNWNISFFLLFQKFKSVEIGLFPWSPDTVWKQSTVSYDNEFL